jgi:hypothetical protein
MAEPGEPQVPNTAGTSSVPWPLAGLIAVAINLVVLNNVIRYAVYSVDSDPERATLQAIIICIVSLVGWGVSDGFRATHQTLSRLMAAGVLACFLANLFTTYLGLATAGTQKTAESQKAVQEEQRREKTISDKKAELARILMIPTSPQQVKDAEDTLARAIELSKEECAKGRGPRCLKKEDDEAAARKALSAVRTKMSAVEATEALKAEIGRLEKEARDAKPAIGDAKTAAVAQLGLGDSSPIAISWATLSFAAFLDFTCASFWRAFFAGFRLWSARFRQARRAVKAEAQRVTAATPRVAVGGADKDVAKPSPPPPTTARPRPVTDPIEDALRRLLVPEPGSWAEPRAVYDALVHEVGPVEGSKMGNAVLRIGFKALKRNGRPVIRDARLVAPLPKEE